MKKYGIIVKDLDIQIPITNDEKRHVYHLLSAYYAPSKKVNRNSLIEKLFKNYSIKCAVQYYPLYKYDLFKKKQVLIQGVQRCLQYFL